MDLTWIDVADTAVKIGFTAVVTAVSGYFLLVKTQAHETKKEEKVHFYKFQDEKKSKYVEFLSQSQELIQSYLYTDCARDSEHYKKYLRAYNEIQIISDDAIRIAANNLVSGVSDSIFLNKNNPSPTAEGAIFKVAHERLALFQKIAQAEVTKVYEKT
jgi:hypothetical protein